MPKVLSINLPMWSVDLVRRRRRSQSITNVPREDQRDANPPILLVHLQHGSHIIAQCCELAARAGVRSGMSLAHARALLERDDCRIEPFNPQRDDEALHRLAVWALRYSPRVAPDPPDGLLIDITGCERLFRGEHRLAQKIAREIAALGFDVRIGGAATFGCAWAVARFGCAGSPLPLGEGPGVRAGRAKGDQPLQHTVREAALTPTLSHREREHQSKIQNPKSKIVLVPPGHERDALAPLPIRALRIDEQTATALEEIEITRIGHLFDLPRAQLAQRFGGELLLRLDQALGNAFEIIEPVRPQPPPSVERCFDSPTTQFEAIELTLRDLLQALCDQLLRLEQGMRRLDLEVIRIDATPVLSTITLSMPSRSVRYLWSLLRPRVEKINLGFGVERITLTAVRIGRLAHEQIEQWHDGAASTTIQLKLETAIGELIDTLAARLGIDRVLRIELSETHIPELSFRLNSATAPPRRGATSAAVTTAPRPTLLLSQPEPVQIGWQAHHLLICWRGFQRRILACIGPERIAPPWWRWRHDEPTRDYFRLQYDGGGWLWVYREITVKAEADKTLGGKWGGWFIHGVWS